MVGSTSINNRGGISSGLVLGLSETSFNETMTKHQLQDCMSFRVWFKVDRGGEKTLSN